MEMSYTQEQLISVTKFSNRDLEEIKNCRRDFNQLGFAYQLAFVRLLNRLPSQEPLEIQEDILVFVSTQLNTDIECFEQYGGCQQTVSEHQENIRSYLALRLFNTAIAEIEDFLFKEAYQLEQTTTLTARLREFLRTHSILEPAQDTMLRTVQAQREAARTAIYDKVAGELCNETKLCLDGLLATDDDTYSPLYYLKKPPGNPSPAAFIKLTEILDQIKKTGILCLDMSWLNNNLQRSLARYARQCSTYRIKNLKD